ncbi:hypothetical protein [Streptomyces sp. NPDC050264]|uniref:hypothetical protein n=1 Tax=Streptomyces sp. NPDC050264 TaxID=3155038 RepID=UPI00343D0A65
MTVKAKKFAYGWVLVSAACTAVLFAATARPDGGDGDRSGSPNGTGTATGVTRLTARELSDRAEQELLNTSSLHVTVADRSKGAGATSPSAMDLILDRDKDCMATLSFGAHGKADIVRRGDRVWVRMDDKLWRAQLPGAEGRAAAEQFKGRYVTGPVGTSALKNFASVCDLNALRKRLRGGTSADEVGKKGTPTTLGGTPVIPLTGEKDGTTTTLYVAARGRPYALKYTEVSAGAAGARTTDTTTLYADYGKPVPLKTPPASESVEVSKLSSLGAT